MNNSQESKKLSKTICTLLGLSLCLSYLPTTSTYGSVASSGGGNVATTGGNNGDGTTEEEEEEVIPPMFADIENHWARETIEAMVTMGLMFPLDEENFYPDRNMTRAEFVTIVVNYIYPTADYVEEGAYWYSGHFDTAQKEGILPETWREKYLGEDITRQEMAFILTKTIQEPLDQLVDSKTIPDYTSITKSSSDDYRTSVLTVYTLGLMGGKDANGTFFPQAYGSRAECAQVLLNFVSEDLRIPATLPRDPATPTDVNRLDLTYTKNRSSMSYDITDPTRPIAKVDDTVLINGTEYTILKHPSGAAADGMYVPYLPGIALDAGIDTYSLHGVVEHGFSGGGVHYEGQGWYINPFTKEGYWQSQWEGILARSKKPSPPGTTDGQASSDSLWAWSAKQYAWIPAYSWVSGQ